MSQISPILLDIFLEIIALGVKSKYIKVLGKQNKIKKSDINKWGIQISTKWPL